MGDRLGVTLGDIALAWRISCYHANNTRANLLPRQAVFGQTLLLGFSSAISYLNSESTACTVCPRGLQFAKNLGKTEGMRASITNLGQAVRSRRSQLDLTQQEVAQAGGPSDTTQTAIETESATSVRKETLRKLDKGLQWVPGSAQAAYDGGQPTPLPGTAGSRDHGAASTPTVQTHRIRAEPIIGLVFAMQRLREGIVSFRIGAMSPEDFAEIAEIAANAGAGVIGEFLGGADQMGAFADALKYLASDSSAPASSIARVADIESSSTARSS